MTTHSSTLAWKIPWMEEPGRLQSKGLKEPDTTEQLLSFFTFMHWRRKWQSTPVFLPGESQGWGSLVGCCLWSRTEWDTTEATQQQQQQQCDRSAFCNLKKTSIFYISIRAPTLPFSNFSLYFLALRRLQRLQKHKLLEKGVETSGNHVVLL